MTLLHPRSARVALGLALVLCTGTACAGMSSAQFQESSNSLRSDLRALDGVRSVRVSGEPGDQLVPGSVGFAVRMAPSASAADVLAVVDAAYAGFEGTFASESANLGIDLAATTSNCTPSTPQLRPRTAARHSSRRSSYNLTVNGQDTAFFQSRLCTTRDVPRWQRSLNAWFIALQRHVPCLRPGPAKTTSYPDRPPRCRTPR